MRVANNCLIIVPGRQPREGWEETFLPQTGPLTTNSCWKSRSRFKKLGEVSAKTA